MSVSLTFWPGSLFSVARIPACGYFGCEMVFSYMKIPFILKMFLICIKELSERVNGIFPGEDLLVDGYCAFLRPTVWIWDSCIL